MSKILVSFDWKTANYYGAEHALQLGGYDFCPMSLYKGQQETNPVANMAIIVKISKDGIEAKIVLTREELDKAKEAFKKAVELYRWYREQPGYNKPEARYAILGEQYTSVTQITGQILAKPALMQWYYKMGKDGKDPNEFRDSRAARGSSIHKLIEMFLLGKNVDLSTNEEYATIMSKFAMFGQKMSLEPVQTERKVFNTDYEIAGTRDCLAYCDEKKLLMWINKEK